MYMYTYTLALTVIVATAIYGQRVGEAAYACMVLRLYYYD